MNSNYYETIAGILKKKFSVNNWEELYIPYNDFYIWRGRDRYTMQTEFHNRDLYWVGLGLVGNSYCRYKLSKYRLTLASALRTADRIQERGFDEWNRKIEELMKK